MSRRMRFWLYVGRFAYGRVSKIVAAAGHSRWWEDFESGEVFFDDEAARAAAVSLERAGLKGEAV